MPVPSRRSFLKQSALLAGTLAASSHCLAHGFDEDLLDDEFYVTRLFGYEFVERRADVFNERSLWVYNIHTGEHLKIPFCIEGRYVADSIQSLDLILRDHRANEATAMQFALYEKMYYLQQLFEIKEPLYVISGYRAPQTNSEMHHHSNGVAEHSLHMQGKAVDIRIPGVSHRDLHKAALAMHSGGVGYYPKDGFVHIDTGRTRQWLG